MKNRKILCMLILLSTGAYAFQIKPKKEKQTLPLQKENKLIWDQALKFREERDQFKELTQEAISQEKVAMQQLEEQVDENRRLCEIHGSLIEKCQRYSEVINKLESVNKSNESKIKELEQLLKKQKEETKGGAGDDKKNGDSLSSHLDVCSMCNGTRKKAKQ